MNEPIDHHYLPVFYLSRWVREDGRVYRFSRPNGNEVKVKPVVPKGTGYEPRLYEMSGMPPDRAQAMETDFLAALDSQAALALQMLERGIAERDWTSSSRSDWSRFLLAQMLRAPEDIAQLKSSVSEDWSAAIPDIQRVYDEHRTEKDPVTVDEYFAQQNVGQVDELAFGVARKLMNHPRICSLINNMHWRVLSAIGTDAALLTSDRPIWMTSTFIEEDAFILMPIGPTNLFVASRSLSTLGQIEAKRRKTLVKEVNKLVVQHAVRFVYGTDKSILPFVQKHMSAMRHSTLLERVANMRNFKIVSPSSPFTSK